MKITLNAESLRMTVLNQIVKNASIGMSIERGRNIVDWIFPFTPKNLRLSRNRKRGEKLEKFELALSKNKSELIEIDFNEVNFIYEGWNF